MRSHPSPLEKNHAQRRQSARTQGHSRTGSIISLPPDAPVADAARIMVEEGIHCVLVMERDRLAGIVSERDVLHKVVAADRDPLSTTLADIMSTPVACAVPRTSLNEIRQLMRERRLHHVPVLNDNHVVGMISIGDLNEVEHDVQVQTIRYLERYMSVR